MARLNVVRVGQNDEILHRPVKRVVEFDATLHRLLDNMLETMRESQGAGLAGPQVGVDLRLFVAEFPEDEDDPENTLRSYEMINPEIVRQKGSDVGMEGCLSIPGIAADVSRSTYILIKAQDRYGKKFRMKAYGWLARVFLHEIDHLHGILMTDKAEQLYHLENDEEGNLKIIPLEERLPA